MSLQARVEEVRRRDGLRAEPDADRSYLDALKVRVDALIDLPALVGSGPGWRMRAESELRAACAAVLAREPWIVPAEHRAQAAQELAGSLFGFGPLRPYLEDESITEIMVNGTRSAFIERDGAIEPIDPPFHDEQAIRSFVDRILGPLGRRIDESSPFVDARFVEGHRLHAIIPPLALDGTHLTIRKFSRRVLTLADFVERGSLEGRVADALRALVSARRNVAVSGGTGSGKTTLLNALSCEIDPRERIVTIEDSAELRFLEHPHVVRLEARPRNAEGAGLVTIRDLVANALRMRPDRIIVGECRGAEALDMLQAMNTGHDGSLTTLHANSAQDALVRLAMMVRFGCDLPLDAIDRQSAAALDFIVHVARDRAGRRFLQSLCRVEFDAASGIARAVPCYEREGVEHAGRWLRDPFEGGLGRAVAAPSARLEGEKGEGSPCRA